MGGMERTLSTPIRRDLDSKIVLLSGPRQVGKTFLSRNLGYPHVTYLNYDVEADRRLLARQEWDRQSDLVVLDELHKRKNWKGWLKGIYDAEGVRPRLLVTGSSRLDVFRRTGDSLAGRHFLFRLHPLTLREVGGDSEAALTTQLATGGFPEPFLRGEAGWARRWRKSHLDRILREDLLDLEQVRNLKGLEVLVQLLSERVGAPISYSSLARDLETSPPTIKRWIDVLERMFVVFVVTPYSRNLARGLLREPKVYFYDVGRVTDDGGARFENLVACHLLARAHWLEDTQGERVALHYVRDREKREVDFATVRDGKLEWLVEAKLSEDMLSPHLRYFSERLSTSAAFQLVRKPVRTRQSGKCRVETAANWLAALET